MKLEGKCGWHCANGTPAARNTGPPAASAVEEHLLGQCPPHLLAVAKRGWTAKRVSWQRPGEAIFLCSAFGRHSTLMDGAGFVANAGGLLMWVVVAFAAIALVVTLIVIAVLRGETERHDDPPWELSHLAGQHVFIMAGLAGFAVTGIVLTVGLLQGKSTSSVALSTVVVMMFVAYFFYVGNAFLFSYFLPNQGTGKSVPPRVHFALGSTIEYRTLFVSWLALMPLLDAYGLDLPRQILGWLVPISMIFGSVIMVVVTTSVGLMRIREVVGTVLLATVLAHGYGLLVHAVFPGMKWEFSSIAVTIIVFGLNGAGFMLAAITPLSVRYQPVETFFEKYGRRIVIADLASTVVALSLLGLAVAGTI